jgi:hypothetical protein
VASIIADGGRGDDIVSRHNCASNKLKAIRAVKIGKKNFAPLFRNVSQICSIFHHFPKRFFLPEKEGKRGKRRSKRKKRFSRAHLSRGKID